MYPVVNLRRLGVGARVYVEGLEDAMVRTAGVYGVSARVRCLMTSCVKLEHQGQRYSHVRAHSLVQNCILSTLLCVTC